MPSTFPIRITISMFLIAVAALITGCGDEDPVQPAVNVADVNGYLADLTTSGGHPQRVYLVNNPSHLEAVDPVVEGIARARQDLLAEDRRRRVLPLLLHGDADPAENACFGCRIKETHSGLLASPIKITNHCWGWNLCLGRGVGTTGKTDQVNPYSYSSDHGATVAKGVRVVNSFST